MPDTPTGGGHRSGRRASREASATQRALGLLTRREHSRKELTRKLTSRGMDAAEVEAAVGKLADAGWQNDARFAESLVRSRVGGGYGPLRIRAELATHGLDREVVDRAFNSFDGDWAEQARDLVRRRFGPVVDDLAWRRKTAGFLIRRGFPADSVRAAIALDFGDD
jgi:regulatory protein